MAGLREAREMALIAYDQNKINDLDFALLYDMNRSKTPTSHTRTIEILNWTAFQKLIAGLIFDFTETTYIALLMFYSCLMI